MDANTTQNLINELVTKSKDARKNQVSLMFDYARKAYTLSKEIDYKKGQLESLYLIGIYHSLKRNSKECIQISKQIEELVDLDLEFEIYYAHSLKLSGIELVYLGEYEKSFSALYKALEIYERFNDLGEISTTQYLIGNSWRVVGNLAKSLEFLEVALNTCRELSNKPREVDIMIQISIIYIRSNNLELAKKYLFEILTIQRELGLIQNQISTLNNLGEVLIRSKDYSLASEYLNQALELAKQIPEEEVVSNSSLQSIYINLGNNHVLNKDFSKAEMYFIEALKYSNQFREPGMLAGIHFRLSALRFNQNKVEESHKEVQLGLKLINDIVDKSELFDVLDNACETLELVEDYKNAYKLCTKMLQLEMKKNEGMFEQRSVENDIKVRFADAEKQVAIERENNEEISKLNIHLDNVNKEKNEFLGIVAHDLKNPLSNIILLSKMLASQASNITEEEIIDISQDLVETSNRMFELVTNLLDVNAIETGNIRLTISTIDITNILEKIVGRQAVYAESKKINITLKSSIDVRIPSDENSLFQIFENLITNAIKYTPFSKNVLVNVYRSDVFSEVENTEKPFVKVEIIDEGPGISEDEIPKLFQKFSRLSSRPTAGEHSTGLGLSIVKKLVESLQGNVYCESTLGKGSTFIVELPFELQ